VLLTAGLPVMQQSIVVFWLLSPQQQIRSSGVRRANRQTGRQTDGRAPDSCIVAY